MVGKKKAMTSFAFFLKFIYMMDTMCLYQPIFNIIFDKILWIIFSFCDKKNLDLSIYLKG